MTSFSSLAAWQSASSGVNTLNFEGIAAPDDFYSSYAPLTLNGVTFSMPSFGDNLTIVSSGYGSHTFDIGTGDILTFGSEATNEVVNITLPSGVTAFGFDFANQWADPEPDLLISFSTGESFTRTFTAGVQFFGVTSTSPFTSVTLTTTQALDEIDNLRFGQAGAAAATPEPGSLLLAGCGLLVVTFSRIVTGKSEVLL